MDDLEKFTEFLFGDNEGYAYSPYKPTKKDFEQKFFQWPQQKEALHDWIKTASRTMDVYLAPSLFKEKSSTKVDIKSTGVVWVEYDGQDKADFKDLPAPDVIVQTSVPQHLHCYWKTESLVAENVENINRRITYYLEADLSGWDVGQVLRPPGTLNHKYSPPKPVLLKKFTLPAEVHNFGNFSSAPEIKTPVEEIRYDDLLENVEVPQGELYDRVFRRMQFEPGRGMYLMHLGHLLAETGSYSFLQIVSLLYKADCRIKKFVGRADQLTRLCEIASIALFKVEQANRIEAYSPLEIISHAQDIEWLVERWLHSRGMMFISGMPGTGKTQLSFDMAFRLTTGQAFLSKPVTRPCRVVFLSLEMDITELKYIVSLQANEFAAEQAWNEKLLVLAPEEFTYASIEASIKKHKPDVIFIDSLSELTEDSSDEVSAKKLMRWLRRLRKENECAIVMITHNKKTDGKRPRKLTEVLGHSVFGMKIETAISMWEAEGGLEIDVFKERFDHTIPQPLRIVRSENLTFSRSGEITSVSISEGGNELLNSVLGFE